MLSIEPFGQTIESDCEIASQSSANVMLRLRSFFDDPLYILFTKNRIAVSSPLVAGDTKNGSFGGTILHINDVV